MADITTLTTRNTRHFDDRTALHMSQAFHQETELEPLLALLFSQLRALTEAHGLRYENDTVNIEAMAGEKHHHHAQYNLTYQNQALGRLTVYFAERRAINDIETAEDLISLAFTALRNVVLLLELQAAKPANESGQQTDKPSGKIKIAGQDGDKGQTKQEEKADALVLVALDRYHEIAKSRGDEWAHILMSSVQQQLDDGLRQADGVYHIGDDLIAVLLPHTTRSQALEVAKKIRLLVASLHLKEGKIAEQLTASMGICDAKSATNAEEVMERAREALKQAQAAGANEIRLYEAHSQLCLASEG